jgi:hypothetical protein
MVVLLSASSTGSSSSPTWVSVLGTVSQIVVATGIVIGGVVAYYKIIKGRLFRPRVEIIVAPKVVELGGHRGLHVPVSVQNNGQVSLLFSPHASQHVLVGQADATMWEVACNFHEPVRWEDGALKPRRLGLTVPEGQSLRMALNMLAANDSPKRGNRFPGRTIAGRLMDFCGLRDQARCETVKPGESWLREALIPVERETVACLLRVQVYVCTHVAAWEAPIHKMRCCPSKKSVDSERALPPEERRQSRQFGMSFWRDVFVIIDKKDKADDSRWKQAYARLGLGPRTQGDTMPNLRRTRGT